MDFLALTPVGEPQAFAQADVGAKNYVADANGIIRNVAPNHSQALLNAGHVPITPAGWSRPAITVTNADGAKTTHFA